MKNKGQHEMMGFILIVVLVVIALMVFLVIYIRTGEDAGDNSLEVQNLIDAVLEQKTECAIVYEPDYDNVEDLVKSCYNNKRCSNIGKMSCDYLNETLKDIMVAVVESDAKISAYEVDIAFQNEEEYDDLLNFQNGNCNGTINKAQRIIALGNGKINFRIGFCY